MAAARFIDSCRENDSRLGPVVRFFLFLCIGVPAKIFTIIDGIQKKNINFKIKIIYNCIKDSVMYLKLVI